jgi:hypothetical protein
MPQPRRRRHGPQPDRRRALELLAGSRDGCTEAIMLAHGFSIDLMVELIKAGARNGKGRADGCGRQIDSRSPGCQITDARQRALMERGSWTVRSAN